MVKTIAVWLENVPPAPQVTSETWYANQIDQWTSNNSWLLTKESSQNFQSWRFRFEYFFVCLPTNSVCERIRQAARGGSGHCPGFSQAWLSNLDINGRTWNTRGVIFFVWKISWIIPKTCHAIALKGLRNQIFKHLFFSFFTLSQFDF